MTTISFPAYETLDQFTVWSHLDNHDPGREHFRGLISVLESKVNPREQIYALSANEVFMERITQGVPPIFLLDDGETVLPLFVSGWPASMLSVWLSPFPTKTPGDTNQRDYLHWSLGPRTCYHLKVYE